MINVEQGQIVGMAATKPGIFLEQALMHVVAKVFRLVIGVVLDGVTVDFGEFALRELVDLAVGKQDIVEGLAPIFRLFGDQFLRPHLLDLEALGKLHVLPKVGARLTRGLDLLPPELGAPLGIAVSAFLFGPHRAGQDQIGSQGRNGRVDIGNHHEGRRITPTRPDFIIDIRPGLHVVGRAGPVALELAVLERTALCHGVQADLAAERAFGQFPDFLGKLAVFGVGYHHVGRQTVGKGTDFACRTAGRRLAGQREGAIARFGNLANQEVHVVDHVIDPGAARMLVEAHGPVTDHLLVRVGVQFGHLFELVGRHTGKFGHFFQRIFTDKLLEFLEITRARIIRIVLRLAVSTRVAVELGVLFQRVTGAQAVTNIGLADLEIDLVLDEIFVDLAALDDVVADVVEDRQVGLRHKDHAVIGQFETAMLEGRENMHLYVGLGQTTVGDARPQDRVHFGHIRPPEHEGIGLLDVVVAAHRLVNAESAHETGDSRSHAVTGIRVNIIGTETGLEQLDRRVAFPDRPLSGTKDANTIRPVGFHRRFPFFGHDVESLIPSDRRKFTVLVELAVLHAQHGLGQAVFAVHDLGQEIALDAVEAAIHFGIRVTLRGHDAAVLHADQHRATGTAETANPLVPAYRRRTAFFGRCGQGRYGDSGTGRRSGNRLGLDEITSIDGHG